MISKTEMWMIFRRDFKLIDPIGTKNVRKSSMKIDPSYFCLCG